MEEYNVLSSKQHFYSISELMESGMSYYKINKLVKDGSLLKLNNKMYENTGYKGDESDFAIVSAYAPRGVFCMMTAARFYGLTTYLPDAIDIAIERDMKISTLPEWPRVNVWYFSKKRYEIGITTASDTCSDFRIFDMEKTVADILYYRNKIGIEETREVLKKYLAKTERNLVKLHRYAKELGSGKILDTYLEVLL